MRKSLLCVLVLALTACQPRTARPSVATSPASQTTASSAPGSFATPEPGQSVSGQGASPDHLLTFRGLEALDPSSVPDLTLHVFGIEEPYQLPPGVSVPGVFADQGLGGTLLVVCPEKPGGSVQITAVDPRGVGYRTSVGAADVRLLASPGDLANPPAPGLCVFPVGFHRSAALWGGAWRISALVNERETVSEVQIPTDLVSVETTPDPSPFGVKPRRFRDKDTLYLFVSGQVPASPLTVVLYRVGPMNKETRLFALVPVVAGTATTDADGRLRLECGIGRDMPAGSYKIALGKDRIELALWESFTVER